MPVEVILPRVDMDMATGKISKWYVKDGDTVAKGVPIFEIETDKAAMEVESPGSGILRNIIAGEGDVVPVGQAVAFIYQEGETADAPPAAAKPAGQAVAPIESAEKHGSSPVSSAAVISVPGKYRATPLARRIARNEGVALDGIIGSGPNGRIIAADLRNRPKPEMKPAEPVPATDVIPVDGMRRTIAERLVLSKQTIPHFYLTLSCDLENLLALREKLNARKSGDKISVNDFVIQAMAHALRQVPDANVMWSEAGLVRLPTIDISVAVAIEGGLFTPVIRAADTKGLVQISHEMRDLAARARARKLVPADYQGGSATISNLGMYGIESFSAIINPPQATILAVGAGIEQPVGDNGEIVLRRQMSCTLSADHRALDGALAARLLAAFKSNIEEPAMMLA